MISEAIVAMEFSLPKTSRECVTRIQHIQKLQCSACCDWRQSSPRVNTQIGGTKPPNLKSLAKISHVALLFDESEGAQHPRFS